ncbi:MAG: DUF11 domain-containing protein [Patescibacteria group bacterium]|jgi:uncharacterized repeat protein (TIGR01451 family)
MMNIIQKSKKYIGLAAIALTVVGSSLVSPLTHAGNPVFNQMQGDKEQLVGRTQDQSAYSNPVTATTQDRVTVAIYIHNSGGSTAANTVVKLSEINAGNTQSHQLVSSISADGVDPVTATIVNGQVVGHSNLTINLDKSATMTYVNGSTAWYPNFGSNPNEPGIVMPDGIMSANGINLGSVESCWDHVGYVLADFVFTSTPTVANLQTEKWVAVYGGNNQWVKENTALVGDQLRYQIYYNNNGGVVATNATITDRLPDGVSYQANSVTKRVKDVNNNDVDIDIPDSQLTISGQNITIPVGNVLPGQGNSGYVYLRVKVNNLSVGTHTLTNNADLVATNAAMVSASALTKVTVSETPVSDVRILKEVVNTSVSGSRWVKENTAKPGDHLQYRLTVYNQGNAGADNVVVKDVLPQHISYVAGSTKIYNVTDPNNGTTLADGIVGNGINIGTVNSGVPNGNKYIVFDAIVSTNITAGNHDLINTASVWLNSMKKYEDTAKTTVTAETGLLLTKEVWSANTGQWVGRLENVRPGDYVLYRIQVRNTGSTTVNNPVIKDILPANVDYISGSTLMDGSAVVDDAWITAGTGIHIANVTAGNFKTITLKVKVQSCPPGGTYTLTNTATVIADGLDLKTATADIVVTAGPPALPR